MNKTHSLKRPFLSGLKSLMLSGESVHPKLPALVAYVAPECLVYSNELVHPFRPSLKHEAVESSESVHHKWPWLRD